MRSEVAWKCEVVHPLLPLRPPRSPAVLLLPLRHSPYPSAAPRSLFLSLCCPSVHRPTAAPLSPHPLVPPGAEQEEEPEGDGARHADPPRRVHARAGAPAAQDAAEAAHGPDPPTAPDRAGEPDRVQQPAGARAAPQACAGAAATAQEPKSESFIKRNGTKKWQK